MRTAILLILIVSGAFAAGADNQPQLTRRKLAQDTVIQGYPCQRGYAWLYPDGRLNRCFVSEETWGILTDPFHGGNFVELYENGSLRSCKLTRDYGGQKRGYRLLLKRRPTSVPST